MIYEGHTYDISGTKPLIWRLSIAAC